MLLCAAAIGAGGLTRCASALPDEEPAIDGGPTGPDGGRADGGSTDGGRFDGGGADGGSTDGGRFDGGGADGGSTDGGSDGGVDGGADGGPDGGRADGGADAGTALDGGIDDGGADGGDAGTTTISGADKIFETTEPNGPSAFDFAVGRALFLVSEVNATQGDFFLFSLEQADAGANTQLSLVSARQANQSGGERGVFKSTGIEDLTARDGGPSDPDTFTAIPQDLVFHEATKDSTHRVPAIEGHIYAFQLNFASDGGAPFHYAAIVVDRIVTPVNDGGAPLPTRQFVEFRWLYQSQPLRRTFDHPFPPRQ
jgi:hypothetical protein